MRHFKISLVALSIIVSLQSYAQKSTYLRCEYKMETVPDTVKPNNKKFDFMVLENSNLRTVFYSYPTFKFDSLMRVDLDNGLSAMEILGKKQQYGKRGALYTIYSDFEKGEITYSEKIGSKMYYYIEPLEMPKWILSNKHETILGYKCQMATCTFRGRTYEAWFTSQVPLRVGPWKLSGLPGLIMKARDIQNHYIFECVSIQKSKESKSITYDSKLGKKVSRLELDATLKRLYANPLEFLQSSGIKITSQDPQNHSLPRPYNPIER